MDAADRTAGSTTLFGKELALDVFDGVIGQRNARIAALLAAVVHKAVLADVQVTPTCAAAPVVCLAVGNRFLKMIEAGVAATGHRAHRVPNFAFCFTERLQLPA